jgi:hypothetical protein
MFKSIFLACKSTTLRCVLLMVFCVFASLVMTAALPVSKSESENSSANPAKQDALNLSDRTGNIVSARVMDDDPEPSVTPTADAAHELVGAFYDVENFPSAKLLLNNKDVIAREVRPTLYNPGGDSFVVEPITIQPNSAQLIDLHDWVDDAGASFQKGSIKLFHKGRDLVIGSQIYLSDESNSLSFEERLGELGKFDSRRLESVWWMPNNQTQVSVVLSNTSPDTLTVKARLSHAPDFAGFTETFILLPHQTRVLDLRTDFTDGGDCANSGIIGLSLEHLGAKSDLKAHGLISNASLQYSSIISFSNPNSAKSSELHGIGFHFGAYGVEILEPIVALKNVGIEEANVTAKVPYTRSNGTNATVTLERVSLRGGDLVLLDMSPIIQLNQLEDLEIAGIEIEYDTAPGNVIVATQSISQNLKHSFRVPMYDTYGQTSSTGGYPWRIEENSSTFTYIKNTTDLEQEYVAYLTWSGGEYMIGLKTIAPHQTVQIDVKRLRDEQTPDERRHTIPASLTEGQIQWTQRSEIFEENQTLKKFELIGRSEQIDIVNGISSSYACQNCCQKAVDFVDVIQTSESDHEVGDQIQFQGVEQGRTCYGATYLYYLPGNAVEWSSSNTNVATVSNTGLATVLNPGDVNIKGKWKVWTSAVYGTFCPINPYLTEPPAGGEKTENLVPNCASCVTRPQEFQPDFPVESIPKVRITPFEAVGKNDVLPVAVQVTGNNNNTPITLNLRKLSGTGESVFTNGNSPTIPANQSGNYEIKGITESSVKDNYIIETKVNNKVIIPAQSMDKFSIAKVKILRTVGTEQPVEITDMMKDVIVGERVKLSAEILPSGITGSSQSWTIPDNIFKDYEVAANNSQGRKVPVDSLTTATANFVWVDGGGAGANDFTEKQVDYKLAVTGGQIKGKTTFKVKRPKFTLATATESVNIIEENGMPFLYFATETNQGIMFQNTAAVQFPTSYTGTTQWVQIVNNSLRRIDFPSGPPSVDNQTGLDGCYPYARRNSGRAFDSPKQGLAGIVVNVNDDFSMWLMFKPNTPDAAWVPIKKVDWSWTAQAILSSGQWTYTESHSMNPAFFDTVSFPEWTRVVPSNDACP